MTFVIAETSTSTWNYHLRSVEAGGKLFFGGGAPPALCGRQLGWDTKIPLTAWGKTSPHINEKWCALCREIATNRGAELPQVIRQASDKTLDRLAFVAGTPPASELLVARRFAEVRREVLLADGPNAPDPNFHPTYIDTPVIEVREKKRR